MQIGHIVVATDLFGAARQAYPHAAAFAKAFGAKVTLLYVDELEDAGAHDDEEVRAYLEQVSSVRRERIEQALRDFQRMGVEAHFEVVTGVPRRAITRFAEEHDAGLIVMGKRTRTGLDRVFLGSSTKRVLRLTEIPVLVVHIFDDRLDVAPQGPASYGRILAASDLGEQSVAGLYATRELAEALGATITALNVLHFPTVFPVVPGEHPLTVPMSGLEDLKAAHTAALESHCDAVGDERIEALMVVGGPPAEAIVETVDAVGADLIAIPSTGKGAIERVLLGSTAERVIRHAPVPVLVMPAPWLEPYMPDEG